MEKFKELSFEETYKVTGGGFGSDFLAYVGYYAHMAWCELKKMHYGGKPPVDMITGEYKPL